MVKEDAEMPVVPSVEGAPLQEMVPEAVRTSVVVAPRTIRYMDDGAFRRCLDKVVGVHDRLLAKLAE